MATEITNSTIKEYITKADAQGNGNGQIDTKEEKDVLFQFCDNEMHHIKKYTNPLFEQRIVQSGAKGIATAGIIGGAIGAISLYAGSRMDNTLPKPPLKLSIFLACLGACFGAEVGAFSVHSLQKETELEIELRQEFEQQVNQLKEEYQSIG